MINNEKFDNEELLRTRTGSSFDAKNLDELFTQLNFKASECFTRHDGRSSSSLEKSINLVFAVYARLLPSLTSLLEK